MRRIQDFAKRLSPVDTLVRRPPWLYSRLRSEISEADQWDLAERRQRQQLTLEEILNAASGVEYYANRGISGPLDAFPLLDKATVREQGEAMRPKNKLIAARAVTSGSTGIPLVLWRSPGSVVFEQATIDHLIANTGLNPLSARALILRADTIKHPDDFAPPFWKHLSSSKAVLSTHHLNASTFQAYTKFIRTFRPDVLFAYPSALDLLLRMLEDSSEKLRLPLVVTSSEAPAPDLRKRAGKLLGALMLDYYGQAERVALAWSIEDGKYWFRPEYGAVEFVPSNGGLEVTGTNLHNSAQYLIRYRTGDIAAIDGRTHPLQLERIALGLEAFCGISGRTSEFLTLADGTRIVGLNHIVRDVPGAASTQIVQKDHDHAEMIVVPAADFGDLTVSTLRKRFTDKVPSSVNCEIRIVENPRRTPAGKTPLFINEMDTAP